MNTCPVISKIIAARRLEIPLIVISMLAITACTSTGFSGYTGSTVDTPAKTANIYGSSYPAPEDGNSPAADIQKSALSANDTLALRNNGYGVSNELSNDTPTAEELAERRISVLYPQVEHGKCKGGWGRQAQKLDGKRITPGHPYYIEIRMRHTPPLPIGHTYTAYGRLGPNGEKLDEQLIMLAPVGGYAGASLASAVYVPAQTLPSKTDCTAKPIAAYRVSLSAQQYENLLKEIRQIKIDQPKYHLFAYNCNTLTSRISNSVGIKPPTNIYTSSLVYMYDIIKLDRARYGKT